MSPIYLVNIQEWCRSQCRASPQFYYKNNHTQVTLIVEGLPPFTACSAEKAAEEAWQFLNRIIKNHSNNNNNLLDRGVHIPLKILKTATRIVDCIGKDKVHCSLSRDVFVVSFPEQALVMNVYCEGDQVKAYVYGSKYQEFTVSDDKDIVFVVDFICD